MKIKIKMDKKVLAEVPAAYALAGGAENLGRLLNRKHYYFVPFGQDDAQNKPTSLVADFTQIPQTLACALEGKQIQPLLI